MASKTFSDWADVRQLVMEKLTNRIQSLLKEREGILSNNFFFIPIEKEEWDASNEEERDLISKKSKSQRIEKIREEINVLAKKLVEATEGNVTFDLAAGRLTDFCSK